LFGGTTMERKQRGFTLIELMITLAVLAIIAMMAAPSFGTMLDRQNLNRSSSDLMGTLSKARAKAAIERREIRVSIGAGTDTDTTLFWSPTGNAVLNSGTDIRFMPNGLVRDPTTNVVIGADTVFEICDNSVDATASKTISISRMGTVQIPVDGDCT
jgi:type IV fimbrial biogenesis protein FimT